MGFSTGAAYHLSEVKHGGIISCFSVGVDLQFLISQCIYT